MCVCVGGGGWNYLSIPRLQRLHRWSLGMDKQFHPIHYNVCNYSSMLGIKLNHVSKRGHRVKKWNMYLTDEAPSKGFSQWIPHVGHPIFHAPQCGTGGGLWLAWEQRHACTTSVCSTFDSQAWRKHRLNIMQRFTHRTLDGTEQRDYNGLNYIAFHSWYQFIYIFISIYQWLSPLRIPYSLHTGVTVVYHEAIYLYIMYMYDVIVILLKPRATK